MAIPHSQSNPNAYSVGLSVTICHCDEVKNERRSNLKIWTDYLTTLITLAMTGFPLLSLLQALDTRKWISNGIESANNSPITDKFNLGVIQV